MSTLLSVLALAALFVLFGLLPGEGKRGCGGEGCGGGGCASCPLDEETRTPASGEEIR